MPDEEEVLNKLKRNNKTIRLIFCSKFIFAFKSNKTKQTTKKTKREKEREKKRRKFFFTISGYWFPLFISSPFFLQRFRWAPRQTRKNGINFYWMGKLNLFAIRILPFPAFPSGMAFFPEVNGCAVTSRLSKPISGFCVTSRLGIPNKTKSTSGSEPEVTPLTFSSGPEPEVWT